MIKPSELESLRQQYPVGARVELIKMDDPFSPPPPGTKGTVYQGKRKGRGYADNSIGRFE